MKTVAIDALDGLARRGRRPRAPALHERPRRRLRRVAVARAARLRRCHTRELEEGRQQVARMLQEAELRQKNEINALDQQRIGVEREIERLNRLEGWERRHGGYYRR